jgi:hypothetical protein
MVYVVMAFAGTLLFLIRLGFTYFGGGGSDFDLDADFDSDASFSFLSVVSSLGFFMGAGWMGLACRLDWGLGRLSSSLMAAGFGGAMMLAASALSFGARRLDQTNEYDMRGSTVRGVH